MKNYIIRKLGGYPTIDDAIDAVRDGNHAEEKHRILTLAVKKLFNTIHADDILRVAEDGRWVYMGKFLSEDEKKMLMRDASNFIDSKLWNILQTDVRYQSNRKMYISGKNEDDLIAGKLWLLTLDAFNTRLKSMRQGSAIFNKQG